MNEPTKNLLRLVVLISGRGSDLLSLLTHAKYYKIVAVVSDNPDAPGASHAAKFNVPFLSLERSNFTSLKEFKLAILKKVRSLDPDLVALAGFMQIIPPEFVQAFPNRIINIHPSLLPKFPGLDTHKRALEAKEKLHGCSVHFVDDGVDTGPVIAQSALAINPSETPEMLAARVLELEHQLYPAVANSLAQLKAYQD